LRAEVPTNCQNNPWNKKKIENVWSMLTYTVVISTWVTVIFLICFSLYLLLWNPFYMQMTKVSLDYVGNIPCSLFPQFKIHTSRQPLLMLFLPCCAAGLLSNLLSLWIQHCQRLWLALAHSACWNSFNHCPTSDHSLVFFSLLRSKPT
jgi:hypothetical protein